MMVDCWAASMVVLMVELTAGKWAVLLADYSADYSVEWMVASMAECWVEWMVELMVELKVAQSADPKVALMAVT